MAQINGFVANYIGLSHKEVKQQQDLYGKNELVPEKKHTLWKQVLSIFKEPMFLLLFFTALLYFLLGEPRDGIVMLLFVAFMSGINLFQEWRTDKTLQALKELSSPQVQVIRDGQLKNIDSKELTVGDLMLLKEGEKISADGRVIEMHDLGVDESTLTGESEVVWKKLLLDEEEQKLHWRRDCCYAGSMVTQGSAIAEVTAIGLGTEYGKIGLDVASVPQQPTILERQTRYLIKICAFISFVLFVLVTVVNYVHSFHFIDSILAGITLAMGMIPEEFPVILTVFLSMGAWRLAKRNSLIRRIPSTETLGAVSVLCVDKTGTLTKNQMIVQAVYSFKETDEKELLYWAGLACETEPYDPMEKAILESAENKGMEKSKLFSKKLLKEYPFSSETKMMGHVWEIGEEPALAAKGSPESILSLCHLNKTDEEVIMREQVKMARQGLRVIAVARRIKMESIPDHLHDNNLELMGLIGLADPPREAVPEAIKTCHRAGIRVVMITGDNGTTARSIAEKIGIRHNDQVITGQELEQLTDEQLQERVKTTNIFARVIPRHKMRIVKALQAEGEIVAMTGDGVNDAPALKHADIGIAMGKRGTGVAKEAADMILLDDNFTTIVDTIRNGRRIYDNIKKAIGYVFVIHIPIALIALMAPLLHLPLLLYPIHVVLLELIIDPTCSIVFERQPAEKDIMEREPRSTAEPLVTSQLMVKSVLQGLAIFGVAFGSYAYLLNLGCPVEAARTFVLVILIFANLFLVYVNQSQNEFAFSYIGIILRDKVIRNINIVILIGLVLIVYLPGANNLVKTVPISIHQFMIAVLLAAVSTFWWEFVKLVRKRTKLA